MTPNTLFAIALATTASTALSHGALSAYSQDFEGLNQADPAALANDGWLVFGNVFDGGGNFEYGYGPFGAPNGGPGFSAITSGEGGPSQGLQGLVAYNDYNNGDHNNPDRVIEANVFQEQIIGPGSLGAYQFQFDAKAGDLLAPSTALAFIKVLDPNNGFSLSEFLTIDTTSLPVDWGTYSIDVRPYAYTGQILQFGFLNTSSEFTPSGVQYDNVSFGSIPEPTAALLLGLSGLAFLRRRR